MVFTLHIISIGSFLGSLLILTFAIYSLIYLKAFRSKRIVLHFFLLQVSLFIFLFSHALYSSGKNPDLVKTISEICYFGAASVIVTSYFFVESVTDRPHKIYRRILVIYTSLLSISIFLPGNHYFTGILNPVKSYSSVIKGPLFPILVASIVLPIFPSLLILGRYILSGPVHKKLGGPILISMCIWFTGATFDGIFSSILSITTPNLWIGPVVTAIGIAFFTAKISEHQRREIELIKSEKEIIYNNLIHDKLSGVYTRAYIFESLIQRKSLQLRNNHIDSLLFIDIDNFKRINDELGHKCGDDVLEMLGRILINNTRSEDIPSRLGGDEFVILLDDCGPDGAQHVAQTIQKLFHRGIVQSFDEWDKKDTITLSMGIISSGDWADTPKEIIHQADMAMYKSKRSGKNMISLYDKSLERRDQ